MTGRELFEYLKEKGMADEELLIKGDGFEKRSKIEADNIDDYCDVVVINIQVR